MRSQEGGLILDPTDSAERTFAGATSQAEDAFFYGGGADYAFTRHPSLCADYRGLVYNAPNFNLASRTQIRRHILHSCLLLLVEGNQGEKPCG